MQTKFSNHKEKIVWMCAAGASLLVFLASMGFSAASHSALNADLAAIHKKESVIEDSVAAAEALRESIRECRASLASAGTAYDNFWSAYLGWTDEFDVMLSYGIFAADTVALIAIPQVAADGDDALDLARSVSCS